MNQERQGLKTPQVEPERLFDMAIDFLAATEEWRQETGQRMDEAGETSLEKARQREQQVTTLAAQHEELQRLKLATLVDPEKYQRPLDEALVDYHRGRAQTLGAYATSVATERPKFAGIRERFAGMRQKYHESRARKAAGRLILADGR